jgi:ribose transport system permease protein
MTVLTKEQEPTVPARRSLFGPKALATNRVLQLILVEVVLVVVFSSFNAAFVSELNVRAMILTASQVVLLAVAQAILMSAGQIDISQGAAVIVSSVFAGKLMIAMKEQPAAAIILGLVVCVVAGAVMGLISGLLVGLAKINSLVVTLGMLSVGTGAAQVLTNGVNLFGLPLALQSKFGSVHVGVIPLAAFVVAVVVAIVWFLYRQTSWGTHVLAIGSNARAAERVGIKTRWNIVKLFVLSSMMCGLAGFIDLARYSTTNISGHTSDALAAIAGALIGGTALTGGRISFVGAIAGSLLAIILQSGLVIIDVSPFYQTIVIGFMLIIAVGIDRAQRAGSPLTT